MKEKPSSSNWLKLMDRWIIFDPVRWPHRELISRGTALLIILGFLGLRIYQFDRFPQSFGDARHFYAAFKDSAGLPVYAFGHIAIIWGVKLSVWIVETAIYIGYTISYLSRARAKNIAKGFMETAFPVIIASIPILIAFMPYSLPRWAPLSSPSHLYFFLAIMALIVTGGVINLIGLLTLRRAFTIMSEARELIVKGIFRRIRHPLYTGHFIMFFGSLLLRLHTVSIIMYLLFCVGQVVRAGIEERKLMQTFPEYKDYQSRTGMFFPRRGMK
ncbi:MAG: isoprenylcysteine carboxylmethyltransferase family protein [Desulfobacteraceae bacterium]